MNFNNISLPWVQIVEEPMSKTRFRYRGERRCEVLYGENTNLDCKNSPKTYFTVRVHNLPSQAIARLKVSCVSNMPPHQVHPHFLQMRQSKTTDSRVSCDNGICRVDLTSSNPQVEFQNLGIMAIPKKDVDDTLDKKWEEKIDPCNVGFDHQHFRNTIDLSVLRLAIETEIIIPEYNKIQKLATILTQEIKNEFKTTSSLLITAVSHESAPSTGGERMIILTEKKVGKTDEVLFYQLDSEGEKIWEANGFILPENTHHQKSMILNIPPYKDPWIEEPVEVFICLRRQSTKLSAPHAFTYLPDEKYGKMKKRKRIAMGNSSSLLGIIPEEVNGICTCVSCPVHHSQRPTARYDEIFKEDNNTEVNWNEFSYQDSNKNHLGVSTLLSNLEPNRRAESFSNTPNIFSSFDPGLPIHYPVPATTMNNLNSYHSDLLNLNGNEKRPDNVTLQYGNQCWTDSPGPSVKSPANPGPVHLTKNCYSKEEMNNNINLNSNSFQKWENRKLNIRYNENNYANQSHVNLDSNVGFKLNTEDGINCVLNNEGVEELSDSFTKCTFFTG